MPDFNSMTISAACRLLELPHTVATLDSQLVEWGIFDKIDSGSKPKKLVSLARVAASQELYVPTEFGQVKLDRAVIDAVLKSITPSQRSCGDWRKLVAGLRMDGFEVMETPTPTGEEDIFGKPGQVLVQELRRMHPVIAPELDFRNAESEIEVLLDRHGFQIAKGHLSQAVGNFSQGNWSSANAMIRDFYQELLDKIAEYFGCDPAVSDDSKRRYLANEKSGPFLFHEYNEWENERSRPSYVLGLWARLHPHGSHPGLSDEEDCAFRFQIILITTRLFLRRFDKRVSKQNE